MSILIRPTAAIAALLAAAAVGSAAQAADAPAAGKPPANQCFWARNVNSFTAVDDHTVNIRVGVKDVYQMELMGSCPEIRWTEDIAIVARGGSWICSGLDAEVVSPSSIGPQRCPVKVLRKLTPAEVAALPVKHKP